MTEKKTVTVELTPLEAEIAFLALSNHTGISDSTKRINAQVNAVNKVQEGRRRAGLIVPIIARKPDPEPGYYWMVDLDDPGQYLFVAQIEMIWGNLSWAHPGMDEWNTYDPTDERYQIVSRIQEPVI